MVEKTKQEKIAVAISILLFVGIYVAGLVMGLQEIAQKATVTGPASPAER